MSRFVGVLTSKFYVLHINLLVERRDVPDCTLSTNRKNEDNGDLPRHF